MDKYHDDYAKAYAANVESHQANVAKAVEDMAKNAADWTKADNKGLKEREAAVKAADSNPHDWAILIIISKIKNI